ncbi:tetratricopeptide repeat protein [Paenibacillus flagellatus]|uniref:Uncharacterized protein n=1 Tax=Paenibacillus flagellatus TaxID=2211139 RepID=A0A2V5K7T3_9BACL|nr:tetratricopeptide repeat protein [Paenibacillus flagellatus]PYI54882.1 hypothetical protein DLM86_10045 [Paenibacillus flagellatus]
MLKQLFASMHDVLDECIKQYPSADVMRKQDLHKKLEVLKTMSDSFIEEWLNFEEKMSRFLETVPKGIDWNGFPADLSGQPPETSLSSESFKKGQGYFQLLMYDNAIREFEKVVKQHPDFMLGRLYLAMGHMRKGNDAEAYRHFRFITSLTDHAQMKAISFNAMGCIQAKNANLEQAQQLFKLAYMADPTCVEPMINMGICMSHNGDTGAGQGFIH